MVSWKNVELYCHIAIALYSHLLQCIIMHQPFVVRKKQIMEIQLILLEASRCQTLCRFFRRSLSSSRNFACPRRELQWAKTLAKTGQRSRGLTHISHVKTITDIFRMDRAYTYCKTRLTPESLGSRCP